MKDKDLNKLADKFYKLFERANETMLNEHINNVLINACENFEKQNITADDLTQMILEINKQYKALTKKDGVVLNQRMI